jgi:AraC-like DNA-binding protein
MQMLNFEENGSIFCEWYLPQTSAHSEETLQRAQWPGEAGWPPMAGVMIEGDGQRFGERLRVENARAMFTGIALCDGDIGVARGFTNQSHFTRMFNQIVGVSPGARRRRSRNSKRADACWLGGESVAMWSSFRCRRLDGAVAVLFSLILVSCAARPGPEVLTPVAASSGEKALQIYVATTRARESSSGNVFTADRAMLSTLQILSSPCRPTTSPALSKCRPQPLIHGAALL